MGTRWRGRDGLLQRWHAKIVDVFMKFREFTEEPKNFAAPGMLELKSAADLTMGKAWLQQRALPTRDPVDDLSSDEEGVEDDPEAMLSDDAPSSSFRGAAISDVDGDSDSAVRKVRQYEADAKLAQSIADREGWVGSSSGSAGPSAPVISVDDTPPGSRSRGLKRHTSQASSSAGRRNPFPSFRSDASE